MSSKKNTHGRKPLFAAMVLGTALSAMGARTATAHEAADATRRAVTAIDRYCMACWRNAHIDPAHWSDCTQEVYCRLLQRLSPDLWDRVLTDEAEERREFIRAIDTVKKRSQRSRKYSPTDVATVADAVDPTARQRADERAAVAQAGNRLLSQRQQRILQLSLDGWTVQDLATELRVPPARVSDEKYKAIRKLQEHFVTAT